LINSSIANYNFSTGEYSIEILGNSSTEQFSLDEWKWPRINLKAYLTTSSLGKGGWINNFSNLSYSIYGSRNNDKILSLLGILNSKVTNFFIQNTCPSVRGGFYRYKTNYVKDIPIPHIDDTQDELISGFVKKIIALKKELSFTKTEQEINAKTKMIDIYEDKVNELVYKLFSLTARDIEIIEKC
jgi:hypothetical protein